MTGRDGDYRDGYRDGYHRDASDPERSGHRRYRDGVRAGRARLADEESGLVGRHNDDEDDE